MEQGREVFVIGIYQILCVSSGRFYIGSGRNMPERWKQHRRDLVAGRHFNPFLQNAWNKHGRDAFRFVVLEVVADVANLLEREREHILTLKPAFNLTDTPQGGPVRIGMKNTPEQNAKIARAHLGKKHTPETLRKMSEAKKGRVPWNKGKTCGPSWNKGRGWTPAQREKLMKVHAERGSLSPEHRRSIGEGLRRAWQEGRRT
jgi:group I intron endonuclease